MLSALFISSAALAAVATDPSAAEKAVKATFLVKFASYIVWSDNALPADAAINICVVGPDPFGAVLDRAAMGRETGGRPVVVRRVTSPTQAVACHLAYLGGSSREVSLARLALGGRPVVTVSDSRQSSVAAIIHFQLVGGRVKFDVDTVAASQSNISISSKLLALARKVRREGTT
ncbi:YfiR family protein [Sphingorhabdus sp.]|uniref:YfiR family protein n=1 Tax=Sphingorhabdus sp. TaxID=1902408 RepID=UPI00391CC1E4